LGREERKGWGKRDGKDAMLEGNMVKGQENEEKEKEGNKENCLQHLLTNSQSAYDCKFVFTIKYFPDITYSVRFRSLHDEERL